MAVVHLKTPFTKEEIRALRIGDLVYVSGQAFTCRSRLHRYVFDEGHPSPRAAEERDLLIHVGPIVLKEEGGFRLVSFMPTSSIRFEKWGARSVRTWGLRMIIGKTTMREESSHAMQEMDCVHVTPVGVSPNLWVPSLRVTGVELFRELGSIEATWHMDLTELGPFVVDMDTVGGMLFDRINADTEKNIRAALQKLGVPDDFRYTELY